MYVPGTALCRPDLRSGVNSDDKQGATLPNSSHNRVSADVRQALLYVKKRPDAGSLLWATRSWRVTGSCHDAADSAVLCAAADPGASATK